MASAIYNEYKKQIGTINWETDTIKVALVDSNYVFDDTQVDGDSNYSDIVATGFELADGVGGYTAGGMALTTKTITRDDVNNWSVYDADDVVWLASTLTARGAIVYKDTGVASTSTLIAMIDFVVDKSSSAGDFTIQWHTDGVFRLG
jgi:hypothetical protein